MISSLDFGAQAALWTRWLGYRWPHYDQMERAAERTLASGGRALIRVGFDGRANVEAEWHLSLFTRRSETPDPCATVAATLDLKPAGMVLHHIVTEEPHEHELTPPNPRATLIAQAVVTATRATKRLRDALEDKRVASHAGERLRSRAGAAQKRALDLIETAIADGLLLRRHFLLVPPMVVKREMLRDADLYVAALGTRAAFANQPVAAAVNWQPPGVAVCAACTLVFEPRRRGTVYCDLCRKHKRPASREVLGQRPLTRGQTQTVRVVDRVGNVIVGWKTATIGLCAECGAPFHGRRDAKVCQKCSNRVRQRRHRARQTGDPSERGSAHRAR